MAGLLVALGLGQAFGIKIGHTLGIYAGSMTSTATLQAALEVMNNKEPSIGYSIAYPFGVIGPILCIYFMTRVVQPKFPAKAQRFHMGEISIGDKFSGRRLDELTKDLPEGVQVTMVRQSGQNVIPAPDLALSPGDAVMIIAERQDVIGEAAARLGKLEPGRLAKDRGDLDYIRVFVGKAGVVGVPLARLPMPAGFPAHILHVRRYDADLVPTPDLMLEFGDRVGVLMPPERRDDVRKHFGDTVKAAAEFSYVSLGLGMVLGVLIGLIPIPVPGVGTVTLGIGGGPLIVALILGKLRRTGPDAVDDAAAGKHRAPQFRAGDVPRDGRRQCRPALCANDRGVRLYDVLYRYRRPADDCVHRPGRRLLSHEDPVRRSGWRRLGRDRKSRHPCLFDQDGADRAAGYRLRHDLPVDDDRESHRRANRRHSRGHRRRRLAAQ